MALGPGEYFIIKYRETVVTEDIPKIAAAWREKIQSSIKEKLVSLPHMYGKPLRRSLKGYWKLRVGDYRVIYRIQDRTVVILAIQHRSVVYKRFE